MNKPSRWALPFFLLVAGTSLVVLVLVVVIFCNFENNVESSNASSNQLSQSRTIPTYLALFIFAQLFQCVLAFDALENQNTIQIFGLCAFTVAMLIYAAIQIDQVRKAILYLSSNDQYDIKQWPMMNALLVAIPCVITLCLVLMSYFSFKLHQEFGWTMYKKVGVNTELRKRYIAYHIYLTLLKYDFFFFLGFTLQFIVIVLNSRDIEFGFTIAMIPVTVIWLYLAHYFVQRESTRGMMAILVVFVGGLAYFLFKAIRMYQPNEAYKYEAARKSLTIFAVLTMLLLAASLVNAVICMRNFDMGLAPIINNEIQLSKKRRVTRKWSGKSLAVAGDGLSRSNTSYTLTALDSEAYSIAPSFHTYSENEDTMPIVPLQTFSHGRSNSVSKGFAGGSANPYSMKRPIVTLDS